MGINIGNKKLIDLFLGNKAVKAVYSGATLIWQKISDQTLSFVYEPPGRLPNNSLNTAYPQVGPVFAFYSEDKDGNELTPTINATTGAVEYKYDFMGKRGAAYFEVFFPHTVYNPSNSTFYALNSASPFTITGLNASSIYRTSPYAFATKTGYATAQNLLYAGYRIVYDGPVEETVRITPNYTALSSSANIQSGKCRITRIDLATPGGQDNPKYLQGNYVGCGVPNLSTHRNQDVNTETDAAYMTLRLSAPTKLESVYAVVLLNNIGLSVTDSGWENYYPPENGKLYVGVENVLRELNAPNGVFHGQSSGTDEEMGLYYVPLGRQGSASDANSIVSKDGEVWLNIRVGGLFGSSLLRSGGCCDFFTVSGEFKGYANSARQIIETPLADPNNNNTDINIDMSGIPV